MQTEYSSIRMSTEKSIGTVVYVRRCGPAGEEVALARMADSPKKIERKLAGKRNGYGGGMKPSDLSIEHCAAREAREESGLVIRIEKLEKVAIILFHNTWGDYQCHFYTYDDDKAEPRATSEMLDPRWYRTNALPFEEMMDADKLILPRIFAEDLVKRRLLCGEIWHSDDMIVVDDSIEEIMQELPLLVRP